MANFHTNQFTIAANAKDMLNALRTIRANLASYQDEIGSIKPIEDDMTPRHAFDQISRDIDAWYEYIFNPKGTESDFRPLSETAIVAFDGHGPVYMLSIIYSTAWESNKRASLKLVQSFPAGRYGYAFVDSDEYDQYNMTAYEAGVVADKTIDFVELSGRAERAEFAKLAIVNAETDVAAMGNLAKAAFVMAVKHYPEFTTRDLVDENGDLPEFFGSGTVEDDPDAGWQDAKCTPDQFLNWINPDGFERQMIDEIIAQMPTQFPWEFEVTGIHCVGDDKGVDRLAPLNELQLISSWRNDPLDAVIIEVFDKQGGQLADNGVFLDESDVNLGIIACLLPYLRATAVKVLSDPALPAGRQKPKLKVRLDLDDVEIDEMLDSVHELFTRPPSQRTLKSIV